MGVTTLRVFHLVFPSLCLVGEDGSYDNQVLIYEVDVAEVLVGEELLDGAARLVGEEQLVGAARLVVDGCLVCSVNTPV